jgi:vanillate O-demethylase ferredoxin subunit
MKLEVVSRATLPPRVVAFRLRDAGGAELPPFAPGDHVEVVVPHPDGPLPRAYSLVSDPEDRSVYEIAVRKADPGRGGSAYLHRHVHEGDQLDVSAPRREFPLHDGPEHAVLIAGGIGITPLLPMARHLVRAGRSFELHQAASSAAELVYRDELSAMGIPRYVVHTPGRATLDVATVLEHAPAGAHVYVCGPHPLIDAARRAVQRLGWPASRLHRESFGAAPSPDDGPLRLRLLQSGVELQVAPGTPLLDALLDAGTFMPYECRRGECGSCVVTVVEGTPRHRDVCLSDESRRTSLCTCVSWAEGPDLVLDV